MELTQYSIMAFSKDPFEGSPAAIIVLHESIDISIKQKIAAINGFPETVFLQPIDAIHYRISWFTPLLEVYNAGHATLAAQYVLMKIVDDESQHLFIQWNSEEICIDRDTYNTWKSPIPYQVVKDISNYASRLFNSSHINESLIAGNDLLIALKSSDLVRHYIPDLEVIKSMPFRGISITSKTDNYDYCNRFFAPKYGVNEDFITATAHSYLANYWSNIHDSSNVTGIQLSSRPGIVKSIVMNNEAQLQGDCYLYSRSTIYL